LGSASAATLTRVLEGTRAWAERFYAKARTMPASFHAGIYSSVAHYLKAVKATGTDDAPTVMKQMEKERVHDALASDGYIRADRKMIHDDQAPGGALVQLNFGVGIDGKSVIIIEEG
jgi:hypothetical protein